jgi:hypothetical protein
MNTRNNARLLAKHYHEKAFIRKGFFAIAKFLKKLTGSWCGIFIFFCSDNHVSTL